MRWNSSVCVYLYFQGILGFYKGIIASYVGISETVIHFVIYEAVKATLAAYKTSGADDRKSLRDFFEFMAAGSFSKTIASTIAYPHGKINYVTQYRHRRNASFCFLLQLCSIFKALLSELAVVQEQSTKFARTLFAKASLVLANILRTSTTRLHHACDCV